MNLQDERSLIGKRASGLLFLREEVVQEGRTTPNLSSFILSVADLLRGNFKQSDYGKIILPFPVLRRLDCVLEPTKAAVLSELEKSAPAVPDQR